MRHAEHRRHWKPWKSCSAGTAGPAALLVRGWARARVGADCSSRTAPPGPSAATLYALGGLHYVSKPDVASQPEAETTLDTQQHPPLQQVDKRLAHGPPGFSPMLQARCWAASVLGGGNAGLYGFMDLWCWIYGARACARPLSRGLPQARFWIYGVNPRIARGRLLKSFR